MNDRYGVDPCAATSLSELAILLRQFGPEHGRFIFDFPPDWYAQVRGQFQSAGDVKRLQLTELWLRRVKWTLLPTKARYSNGQPWAQNAALLISDARSLIGPEGSKPPCRALEEVLIDPDALPDCRGGHIPRTSQAYADVAKPLMQISRKVVLIDPYFCLRYQPFGSSTTLPARRHIQTLKALIHVAQVERKVEVFKLMVSPKKALIQDEDGAQFETDLGEIMRDLCATGIAVEYDLLDETQTLDRHPRYLLGNECGLRFDWGFDTANDSSTNHVEWVGTAALKPLLDRFM
jgi:hypothetical protein